MKKNIDINVSKDKAVATASRMIKVTPFTSPFVSQNVSPRGTSASTQQAAPAEEQPGSQKA